MTFSAPSWIKEILKEEEEKVKKMMMMKMIIMLMTMLILILVKDMPYHVISYPFKPSGSKDRLGSIFLRKTSSGATAKPA